MKTLPHSDQPGFSRIDLIAIIVVLGLLLVVSVPAFGRAGMNSKGLRCLNNVRQLGNAWHMYADDNRDRIPYASTGGGGRFGGSVPVNSNPQDPNNYAWSGAHLDFSVGLANRANWDVNYDIVRRPLWPYTGRDASLYKCPEDQSSVVSPSGTIVPRVQSMTMNTYLGGFAGTLGFGENQPASARLYFKTTEFTSITPAKLFVFTDGRPDAIVWSDFLVNMSGFSPSNPSQYQFGDIPGFSHDGGAAISFADGSGELHLWQDARTVPPFNPGAILAVEVPTSPNNPDVAWLQDHASRPK